MRIPSNFEGNLWISSKICGFHVEIHRFSGLYSFCTPKSIQKSADFSEICGFSKLNVSLMLTSWRLREKWGFFLILMEICGFQTKSADSVGNLWTSNKICRFWRKSVDFIKTKCFPDVDLLEVEREMRILSNFDGNPWISSKNPWILNKICRFQGNPQIFVPNPHIWGLGFASSKVFRLKNERPNINVANIDRLLNYIYLSLLHYSNWFKSRCIERLLIDSNIHIHGSQWH